MIYKYKVDFTTDFKKDYKKILKQGKNVTKLKEIVELIACDKKIPSIYKNHKLKECRKFKDCYELHIEPDWLLIYRIRYNILTLVLVNTGSHSDLFK